MSDNPITLDRAMSSIQTIMMDGHERQTEFANEVNAYLVLRAMQEGYRMCEADNGLTPKVFPEPASQVWGAEK